MLSVGHFGWDPAASVDGHHTPPHHSEKSIPTPVCYVCAPMSYVCLCIYVCYICSSVSASGNVCVACTLSGCMACMSAYVYVPYTCTCVLSHVLLFVTLWSGACQIPLSMEFSRQKYWSGLPFPSEDLPDPGIKPMSLVFPASPAWAGWFFTSWTTMEAHIPYICVYYSCVYTYAMHFVFIYCVYFVYVLIFAYMYLCYVCLYITPVCIHVIHVFLYVCSMCVYMCLYVLCMYVYYTCTHACMCMYMCILIFLTLLLTTVPIKISLDLAIFHYDNLLKGKFLEERVKLFKESSYTLLDSFSKCWDNLLQGNQTVWRLWDGTLKTPNCKECIAPSIMHALRFITVSGARWTFPTPDFGLKIPQRSRGSFLRRHRVFT